jgi:glycosyltransferase involved in cell wall biosynthesis
MVMTGLMRYRPNIDAAAFFVNDIFPQILAERPHARVFIVGGDPPEEVTRLASANVIVTGSVPDVRPFVRKAAVVVVPLRMGGGTRLKVLEGLSMKKAMVSTSIGCEGIEVEDEKHLLVANDADAFAGAVLRLLNDSSAGMQLGEEGYALVVRQYRWEMVVERLEGLYEQLVASGVSRRNSA